MFGISIFELIVIAVVALVFVGPKRLPEIMRQGGKLFVQLRRTANDVKSQFDGVINQAEEEIRKVEREKFLKLLDVQQELHKPVIPDEQLQIPDHPPVEYHPFEEPPFPSETAAEVEPVSSAVHVGTTAPGIATVKVSPPSFDTPNISQSSGESVETPEVKKQET